ncbi:phosphonate ABC transporter ATP-binding protein [Paeniglutamicibacter terrestris]|uniref:ATP-binding cassette domain-containing protein n=1 Tax=Paeniglutamicibacter terrestris TaxID=2723403 RepID=A0ABX1G640_9MICC|nr:ATP-binding cassette domain-containing protein [Paeniglutamicibacter terrestris]ASN40362.1 phosphonate ABC transporter [Arthrobacter sp. 7749]NKG21742.1 ATP-binding cassette domain-containing protein [Paeniglutamicibacter terrestris]
MTTLRLPHPPLLQGAPPREEILQVENLTKSFGGRTVLDGVNFTLTRGSVVAFLGANGSGKSTTLKCIMGLETLDAGSIKLNGTELSTLRGTALVRVRSSVAMIFQKIHLVPRRTALENVCAGALGRLSGPASFSPMFFPRELKEEAMAALARVGLADRAHEKAGRLSGGQAQRVAVARALCQRASVLLADEPVSALDPRAAEEVMELLAELAREENLAVAAVLHQPNLAVRHADSVVGLIDGRIEYSGDISGLDASMQARLYTPNRAAA